MSELVVQQPVPGLPRSQSLISPALSRAVMWILVLAAAAWTLEHIKTTLTVFGLGFFIAYLLNSVVAQLEQRYSMRRGRAILLVYLSLFAGAVLVAALLVPLIVQQVNAMVAQIPILPLKMQAVSTTLRENWLSRVPEQYQAQLKESIQGSATWAAEAAKTLFVHMRAFLLGLISAAFLIFMAIIVSIFVILSWYDLGKNVLDILPDSYRQEIRNLGMDLHRIFGSYIRAMITLATAAGVLTLVVLGLHAMVVRSNPYILVIACIAGLTFPIPVVNQVIPPVIAAILGYINADDGGYAVQLALLVWGVNVVIERTLAPRIMSEAVGVSPLFVLFAAFSGAELLGPVGALLGVPLAAMIKSIFVWFHGRFLAAKEEQEAASSFEGPVPVDAQAVLSDLEQLKVEVTNLRHQNHDVLAELARIKGLAEEANPPAPEAPAEVTAPVAEVAAPVAEAAPPSPAVGEPPTHDTGYSAASPEE